MPRELWKGAIQFGLVHVPVSLYPAEHREDLSFTLLDRRDMQPVGYQRVNKSTGDPVEWGEKALEHYRTLRLDAHTKRLVFSDGLNLPEAFRLYRHFADRVLCGFG